MGKEFTCSARDIGDAGSLPGLERFPGGNGNSFQYSCLKYPVDRRAWRATIRGVAESDMVAKSMTMIQYEEKETCDT